MKVAFCLYGQPRRARDGHATCAALMARHPSIQFDVYLHAWHDPGHTHYDASSWRAIPASDLRVDANVAAFLLQHYRPVAFALEPPRSFNVPGLLESMLGRGSDAAHVRNASNCLSQLRSRQAVRDLVVASGRTYDLVIATRFDFLKPVAIDLHALDTSKMYVADFHRPRAIFPDNFVVASPEIFAHLFDAYDRLPSLMNDAVLDRMLAVYHEPPALTTESILLANFLTRHTLDEVVYTRDIPDFH